MPYDVYIDTEIEGMPVDFEVDIKMTEEMLEDAEIERDYDADWQVGVLYEDWFRKWGDQIRNYNKGALVFYDGWEVFYVYREA